MFGVKMKKSLKTAGIILATAILFSLTGCKPEAHVHNFATEKTDAEVRPGYATNGSTTLVCDCGKEKVIEIEAAGYYEIPIDVFTGKAATKNSTYIYFGVFPNTIKASDVTINENESVIMGGNTYYKGSDGEWYVYTQEDPLVISDKYKYSDGTQANHISEKSYLYFKVQPIKWKVLTNDYNGTRSSLLLAENILIANIPFYTVRNMTTGMTIYPNNYKYSTVRAYLNGIIYRNKKDWVGTGFLHTAFTKTAQEKIEITEVDNGGDSTSDATGTKPKADGSYQEKPRNFTCENTKDKIFLLSEKEVTTPEYGFSYYTATGTASYRIRHITDYAMANYAMPSSTPIDSDFKHGGRWFLRSPYHELYAYAQCISEDGGANKYDLVSHKYIGIVPALVISLQ